MRISLPTQEKCIISSILKWQCVFDRFVLLTVKFCFADGEYESDHEDEELFELESRMSTP